MICIHNKSNEYCIDCDIEKYEDLANIARTSLACYMEKLVLLRNLKFEMDKNNVDNNTRIS